MSGDGSSSDEIIILTDGEENGRDEDDIYEELPKSRVIPIRFVDERSPSPSANKHVLLKSVELELDFPNKKTETLYIYRSVTGDSSSLYIHVNRQKSSPWKGIRSYYPGRFVKRLFEDNPEHWVLYQISKNQSGVVTTGVFLTYQVISSKRIRIDFYLLRERVLNTINDYINLSRYYTRNEQNVLTIIIEGKNDETMDYESQNIILKRRGIEMNFELFYASYGEIRAKSDEVVPNFKLDVKDLNFQLMPYQEDTVRWMVYREAKDAADLNLEWIYCCHSLLTDSSCFYYPFLKAVTRRKLDHQQLSALLKKTTLKGGILADEMGLGKTVQVLSLISSHQRDGIVEIEDSSNPPQEDVAEEQMSNYSIHEQVRIAEISYNEMKNAKRITTMVRYDVDETFTGKTIVCRVCEQFCSASACGWNFKTSKDESFMCPNCFSKTGEQRCLKTTLIIVPESLIFQWFTEIAKHCSDRFKVMFYFGIKKHGYLQPHEMGKYDVILTTYDTIRAEVAFSDVKEQQRILRRDTKPPLYLVSSLVHANFWRVVVDESQVMPQGVNSQLATMLSHIKGENWWCVTGTPLVKTIADIFPLFSFLKLKPFGNPSYFTEHMYSKYLDLFCNERCSDKVFLNEWAPRDLLLQLVSKIMSRKTKEEVKDQINLPMLTETEEKICFTAVQERQYKEEKERLQEVVERSLGYVDNSIRLADLKCRDKVLKELRSLRESVLTGNFNSSAGSDCLIYSPEIVICKLVNSKKKVILNKIRNFVLQANGLAGVQLLMNNPEMALDVYQYTLLKYNELVSGAGLENMKGRENIKALHPVSRSSSPEPYEDLEDNVFDADEDEMFQEELERIKNVTGILKKVQQICNKYVEKPENEEGKAENSKKINEKEIDEDVPGPSKPKRRRLEAEIDTNTRATEPGTSKINEQVAGQSTAETSDNHEEEQQISEVLEERKRQQRCRKIALDAVKPLIMDATQEVHLIINMYKVQESLNVPEEDRIDIDRLEEVCSKFTRIEKESIEKCRDTLRLLTESWSKDERDHLEIIEEFFEQMQTRAQLKSNTDALYDDQYQIRHVVKKDHFPYLPYLALYDTKKKKQIPNEDENEEDNLPGKHNILKCMGGCDGGSNVDSYIGTPCLSIPDVLEKTMDHMKRIDNKRKFVENQMDDLIRLALRMSNPAILINFLIDSEEECDDKETIQSIFACEHSIYKGTSSQREQIHKFYEKENKCKLCDIFAKILSLSFEIGLSSYHGHTRVKCGVLGFATYLVDNFSFGKQKSIHFLNSCLRPFFERIQDTVQAFTLCARIISELIDKVDELRQSRSRITESQVIASMSDRFPDKTTSEMEAIYAEDHFFARDEEIKKAEKVVKELRYLVTLMEKQLVEGEGPEECPVCQTDVESFMHFLCGHRTCKECLEQLIRIKDQDNKPHPPNTVLCPTCRTVSNINQLMLAQSGHKDKDSIIPGVALSAKLTFAIKLIRDTLKNDESNKIILFTTFEPSTAVWNYLVKILKLAKLPYAVTSRSNCGKKIIDFENSENIKVLLCSLSLCANGLNMTGANHIIFLDPPHLQSVLKQAIGRINRFGQKRAMSVHHLVVEGSIDSELREMAKSNRQEEDNKKGWTIGDIRGMFGLEVVQILD
uniref:Helicase ATP-binding domain-containing protein n=1 Tax=Caenorhabditis tropicalis TaxID=1561998 RepID=A0A1I7TIP0_9PELO